jgi:hypothetical protein
MISTTTTATTTTASTGAAGAWNTGAPSDEGALAEDMEPLLAGADSLTGQPGEDPLVAVAAAMEPAAILQAEVTEVTDANE